MVLDFISSFRDIIFHILMKDKTDNQILSDIHLFAEEIKNYISKLDSNNDGLDESKTVFIKTVEYNNALLLSSLRPANIRYFLNSALKEKRYYFFSTTCDMLLNSNLKKEYKNEVLSVYQEATKTYKIPLLLQEAEICALITKICEEILTESMGNNGWKEFAINHIDKKLKTSLAAFFMYDPELKEKILEEIVTALEKY